MRPLAMLAGLTVAGCSSVLGIDSERHLVDAGPAPSSTPWSCLDSAVPTPPAMATLSFVIGDPSTSVSASTPEGLPIPDLVVHACTQLDFSCSNPIESSAPTDVGGRTDLTVPGGFNGYFEVPAVGTFLPAIYSHEPVEGSEIAYQSVMHPNLIQLTAAFVGAKLDPAAATVIPYVLDCASARAAGVVFDVGVLGPSEKLFYLNKSLPSKTATATDATGGAVALNVPPGSVTVKATAPDGQLIASNTTVVRAGWVTFVQLRPSQATLLTK